MPVMKAAQVSQKIRQSPIVMDLSDLERDAAVMISRAQAQAARIMEEARQQAQRETIHIREEARAAGHEEGLQAGMQEGRQRGHDEAVASVSAHLKDLTARWSQTLELLHQHMPAHVADAKSDLVKLAIGIACRVTRQESLRNRQVVTGVVEEALRLASAARKVIVHVNPLEVDTLQQYLPEILAKIGGTEEVDIQPDENVHAGGCLLRCGTGEIDASIETQLDRIADELLGNEPTEGA